MVTSLTTIVHFSLQLGTELALVPFLNILHLEPHDANTQKGQLLVHKL